MAIAMAARPSPPKQPMKEELQRGCAVAFAVLTFNTGAEAYLLWGDVELVASVGVTYVLLLLLSGRRFGYWEPATDGASFRRLDTLVLVLSLSVAALLASRLVRASPFPSSALLVAAAGAAALGVGGCCACLLHRRSWPKQQRQDTILPLMQESSS